MKSRTLLILLFCSSALAAGSGGVNAPEQRGKPYLVLVSIDGFRWDYQDRYATPALDRIAAKGIRAARMVPVFPTLTFPNHYSIATGLYPAHHGLIGNRFLSRDRKRYYDVADRQAVQDGSWYRGEPVWVAAEKAGMVTAACFFVGTEADIDGVPMTYWKAYDEAVPGDERVMQVLDWLAMPADRRPHFITLYFEDVDKASHHAGPDTPASIAAIGKADGYLAELMAGIDALPIASDVYVVVVSDHGQAARKDDEQPFIIDTVVDMNGMFVVDHGAVAFVYLPEPDRSRALSVRDAINRSWTHGKAMLREDAPASWHVDEAAGFADIIVQADPQYLVFSSAERVTTASRGDHGWPREFEAMHGIFLAAGPRLPMGRKIGAIEAVDIYPLLMKILELPATTPIDGDPDLLTRYLGQKAAD